MRSLKHALCSCSGLSLIFVLAGCGGGSAIRSGGGGGGTPPPPSDSVYVLAGVPGYEILQFSRDANGPGAPAATIEGPTTGSFQGLAIDTSGNLYVGDGLSEQYVQIEVYPPGASGSAKTSRTTLVNTGGFRFSSLEVDQAGNVYVAFGAYNLAEVAVFSPTTKGGYVQSRVITGAATNFISPGQMAIDPANNLYVTNGTGLLVFDSSANGNVAPKSTIAGSKTMIDFIGVVALDGAGNIYVVSTYNNPGVKNPPLPAILEFSAGSSGNVAPIRTISGSLADLGGPDGLRVDSAGNIYLLDAGRILKFAPDASGNTAPVAEIKCNVLGLTIGSSIALK